MTDTLADWPAAASFLAEHDLTFTLVPETPAKSMSDLYDPVAEATLRRHLAQAIARAYEVGPQHIGVCAHAGAGQEWWGWNRLCPAHAAVSAQRSRGQRTRLRRMHCAYRRRWQARRRRHA